jgi:isoleucyl-tRNA synthetase
MADRELADTWTRLLAVRDTVNAALEQKRKDKVIGTSLGAKVTLAASGPVAALLEAHRLDLPMICIVSDLELRVTSTSGPDELHVDVEKASGTKCDRCWRVVPTVSEAPEWAGICTRCINALAEPATH